MGMNGVFSYFRAPIRGVVPASGATMRQVWRYVVSDRAKERTCALRLLSEKKERQQYKANHLDYVTPSALVRRRGSGGLVAHSGIIVMDIDGIESEERVMEIKHALIADREMPVAMVFRSPSGDGLKVWYRFDDEAVKHINEGGEEDVGSKHKCYYEAMRSYLRERYAIECDATSDVMRACYLCCDEDAYYNPQPTVLSFSEKCTTNNGLDLQRKMYNSQLPLPPSPCSNPPSPCSLLPSPFTLYSDWDTVEALVRGIELSGVDITGDYHQWVKIGFALASAFGESGRGFYHRVSRFYLGYSNVECNRQYDRCLRARGSGVGLGTFIYLAKTA